MLLFKNHRLAARKIDVRSKSDLENKV